MDRPPAHDYAAASAMAYAQQQQHQQQPPFGFHPQHQGQQFPPPPAFMPPPHPSMQQQFPYPHHLQQQQQHPHAPPHPHLLHHNQPLPGFSGHLPPPILPSPYHGGGGGGAYDSAPPPPAPPPSDPELQKRIDKLVEYSAKNGPEFEAMIRDKQQDNPAYSFLFGGEGHNYYRYKLWVSTRAPPAGPYNAGFAPSSSVPLMHPPPQMMQQPGFAPFYDPHQHHHQSPQPPFGAHGRGGEFDQSFKGLSGPLPPDVAVELTNVMNSLNGTKDSIKGAKIWFMQRSPFAPALAEGMRDRVFSVDDSERQLHVVYLANDILFDSLQRRANPHELDNEALAFKPVLGSMLARIYQNPVNKEENQSRLQKILQFWGAKEVYDHDTIRALEGEMVSGAPTSSVLGAPKDLSDSMAAAAGGGFAHQLTNHHSASHWQLDKQLEHEHVAEKQVPFAAMPPPLAAQQFLANSAPASGFAGPVPIIPAAQPPLLQTPAPTLVEKLPPYPLFPPGLIPGMVRKMQIGSGVPYSPLSPLDIPTMIPPSTVSPSEVLERVSKYFKEIGEVNPSEGPMKSSESDDDYDNDYERDRSPVRKGGACIPPPPNLQVVDPETGTYPDGSVERKPGALGSGRLGLGATADPNEVSQYDDVYSSYRKQRSSNYHTSMSARAAVSVKRSTTTT